MFFTFLQEASLIIINTLPIARGLFSRFMDSTGSKSLLDFGLIDSDHAQSVNSFVIDEQARYAAGSDHALLECYLVVNQSQRLTWSFKESFAYNIHENTNFDGYKSALDLAMTNIPVSQFEQLSAEEMLPHIAENINNSAKNTIGIKIKERKKGRRLPSALIQKIKEKKGLLQSLNLEQDPYSTCLVREKIQALKGSFINIV